MNISDIIMQFPFSPPKYTDNPIFPDILSAALVALIISVAMNFAFAMLRKKTTDMEKMRRVMQETTDWRKQYSDAVKKQDKARIEELRKKQAYISKMSMEMQQQSFRPMIIYMIPSLLIWFTVFPAIFGATVAFSPINLPFIVCTEENVQNDSQKDDQGNRKGLCEVPGGLLLWGWFFVTSFAFSGIISKVTKTGMPSPM